MSRRIAFSLAVMSTMIATMNSDALPPSDLTPTPPPEPPPPPPPPPNRRQRRAAESAKRRQTPRGPVATNVNPLATSGGGAAARAG